MTNINNTINSTSKQDFLVTTATAGVDRKLSITNTDNTNAASHSHLQLTTGGSSGGDPYTNYSITGGGTFSIGIDNSDSDLLKITNGATTSSGTDRITLTSAGVLSLYGQTIAMGGSFAGLPVGLLAGNLDATNAASDCVTELYTQAAGGDPHIFFHIQTAGTNYSLGIDNSDSDAFKITTGATPSAGTTVLTIDTSGNVLYSSQIVNQLYTVNDNVYQEWRNASTGSSASAFHSLVTETGAADAFQNFVIYNSAGPATVTAWAQGIDNSDSDSFKIGSALAPGGTVNPSNATTAIKITTSGEITAPLQPAFLAYVNSNTASQTGNGATPTINYDTEVFDQNSDYNNGTYTFTAPITGRYRFETAINYYDISAAMTVGALFLMTSNRNYYIAFSNPGAIRELTANSATYMGSVLADMDAGDTAYCIAYIANGAGNTAGFAGLNAGYLRSYFSGSLEF